VKEARAYIPMEQLGFNLIGINDQNDAIKGEMILKLYNHEGIVVAHQAKDIKMEPLDKQYIPVVLQLPATPGGYTMVAEFTPKGSASNKTVISRRYLKIGQAGHYVFFDPDPN